MALVMLFAGWHVFLSPLASVSKDIARTFAVAASLLAVLSMVSATVEGFSSLVKMIKGQLEEFMQEVTWDIEQAARLDAFDKAELERALEFLELKSSRIHARIRLFIGGPDRLAVLAIFGGIWVLYKELPAIASFNLGGRADMAYFMQLAVWAVIAFIIGILGGAICLNTRLRRYTYQIEVLKLHLKARP